MIYVFQIISEKFEHCQFEPTNQEFEKFLT